MPDLRNMRSFKLGAWAGGIAAVCALVATGAGARADEVVKTDGQVLRGRIVSETPEALTLEVHTRGVTIRQRVTRSAIKSVNRQTRQGPGYCIVPVHGELGVAVTPQVLREALATARSAGASLALLEIDSDGGEEPAAEELGEIIREHDTTLFRIVALVRRATGAAAVVAVACQDIYLLPEARLAADVPTGKSGSSLQRAIRMSAREAGHHPDWVRGVLQSTGVGSVARAEDDPKGPAGGKRTPAVGRLIPRRDEDDDAAAGVAAELLALRDALGIATWYEADERPRQLMAYAAGAEERARAAARETEARRAALSRARRERAARAPVATAPAVSDAMIDAEQRLTDNRADAASER